MRTFIILLFISFNSLFISFNSLGQGFAFVKVEDKPSKFYLGIGGGVAFRGGAINLGYYNTGINLSLLNMGYRINERFGVSFNLNSSGHSFHSSISRVGIGYMSIGGIISVPIKQFTWDIKPQYAPLVVGQYFGDVLLYTYTDEIFMMGNGFVLGNSLVRSTKKGLTYSLELDFLSSFFNQSRIDGIMYDDISSFNSWFDIPSTYRSFRIGLGIRYNFKTK